MTLTTIGILGAGNMGNAIINGLIKKDIIEPSRINVYDVNQDQLYNLKKTGVNMDYSSNKDVARDSDVILVAVKPQVMKDVMLEISGDLVTDKFLISIAAGIPIAFLESITGKKTAIARVMPNTPALVNSGTSCVAFNEAVTPSQKSDCMEILLAMGSVHEVPEKYLDAVTGLSGSGPAYVFYFLEGLIDGGVKVGLPRDLAKSLAIDTILGSLKLVLETGKHPMQLKDQVTSPGGTTIDALQVLEDGNMKGMLMKAVETATKKSRALSDALNR